ncbi:MAG: tRNA pseudouridine(38-40) synthase TruA [Firmicutes bacterium]|nr:tRNA pseudouridine(38-40) synthase TruA [Bacillota bacterium]
MKNIKLTLSYAGTNYHGFQRQKNAITIQEKVEQALQTVFGESIPLTAAGRTDAGVHAVGQVVNFKVATSIPINRIPYALNANLPHDIVVTAAEFVPDDFHARYCAKSKVYRYTIDNAEHPRVFTRHYALHIGYPLNLTLMQQAAATLVGKHNFRSFMASGSSVQTTERHLLRLDVQKQQQYIEITVEADGFLYNMIRIITGTLIEVGRGKRPPDLTPVLNERSRAAAGWTAPPHGLVMLEVKY